MIVLPVSHHQAGSRSSKGARSIIILTHLLASPPLPTHTDRHARESLHISGLGRLRDHVRDEKDNRYDTRFTPCMTKACPRALNPPEACPRCDKFDAACASLCASFNAYLMQQPDVVCTYSHRLHTVSASSLPFLLPPPRRF